MSRRGEWKTIDGQTIQISQMDDRHLRNSLRYLYRKMRPIAFDGPAPPVNNSWASQTSRSYYEDKFVELGEEAQRRLWLPQNITVEQLVSAVADWEAEAVRAKEAWIRRQAQQSAPLPPPLPMTHPAVSSFVAQARQEVHLRRIAESAPMTIAIYTDIADDMYKIIKERFPKAKAKAAIKLERNISFDL